MQIARLQGMYPRNRLLWLERGSTALRAGQAPTREPRSNLAVLAKDPRPRAFGEEPGGGGRTALAGAPGPDRARRP